MLSRFLIYGLVDPRTGQLRYVGRSMSGLKRPRAHATPSSLSVGDHKSRWITQLLAQGLTYEIIVIEECEREQDLNTQEVFWIAYFRFVGCNLTNLTIGGEGAAGHRASLETRMKLSLAQRGVPKSAEHRAKIGAANKGRPLTYVQSAETRARMSAGHMGQTRNAEMRARMSVAAKKRGISPEQRAAMNAGKIGFKHSAETRAQMSATRQGRVLSAKARANMTAAWVTRKESRLIRTAFFNRTLDQMQNFWSEARFAFPAE